MTVAAHFSRNFPPKTDLFPYHNQFNANQCMERASCAEKTITVDCFLLFFCSRQNKFCSRWFMRSPQFFLKSDRSISIEMCNVVRPYQQQPTAASTALTAESNNKLHSQYRDTAICYYTYATGYKQTIRFMSICLVRNYERAGRWRWQNGHFAHKLKLYKYFPGGLGLSYLDAPMLQLY